MKITIPTIDEIVEQHAITNIGFDLMLRQTGPQTEYGRRCNEPLNDEPRVKLLPRYERWLGHPRVSMQIGQPVLENLTLNSKPREAFVFAERDLNSGIYAVHVALKKNPAAIYLYAELDSATVDQPTFDKAILYAQRIGFENAYKHLVRLTCGRKNYELR